MSYKTILVHIDNEAQAQPLLNAAVRLAEKHEAHLIGTYVAHSFEPYMAHVNEIAITTEISKTLARAEVSRAEVIKKLFDSAAIGDNMVAEWRFDPKVNSGVINAVLNQARSADILVIGKDYKDPPNTIGSDQVGPLVMHCSRPTIVVPDAYEDKTLGEFVFIAWDGSRESSRAVFDALPILQTAKNVWIHRVTSNEEAKHYDENATRDLADTLARHGVNLELSTSVSSARKVGEELLDVARSRGADCIVMGAYGHNRVHELLLGGATRHILANATVPLIMSH